MAASGSMSFPQKKPWSHEDSGSSHRLTSNAGGQFPRPPALGRGPKGMQACAWLAMRLQALAHQMDYLQKGTYHREKKTDFHPCTGDQQTQEWEKETPKHGWGAVFQDVSWMWR